MSQNRPTVVAEKRDRIGSRYARRLREAGRLPGVIYGHGSKPAHVSVSSKELLDHLRHGTRVMTLDIEGAAPETCLVRELQFGYLGDNPIHVDFSRIDLNEEVTLAVTLVFTGEPVLKTGAIIHHNLNELEVTCLARNIPDEIRVDISALDGPITVGMLDLPEGVVAKEDPDSPVVTVAYVGEEAEGEEAAVEGEGIQEPEVISAAAEEKTEDGD